MQAYLPSSVGTVDLAADVALVTNMLSADSPTRARAWATFVARYDAMIRSCIRRTTRRFRQTHEDDDVYAQFLLALTQNDMHRIRAYDPTRGVRFGSWIGLLATHTASDHLRKSARLARQCVELESVAHEPVAPGPQPDDAIIAEEKQAALQRALKHLTPRDQDFMALFYRDALSPDEVAAEMRISVKTVYTKKHKIMHRLERTLVSA